MRVLHSRPPGKRCIEAGQPLLEGDTEAPVVHGCIEFVSLQLRRTIVPILADEIGLRRYGFDGPAQAASNLMFELAVTLSRQHIRHIHAPAVDTEWGLQPVTCDGILAGVHLLTQAQTAIVEFGQAAYSQPGLIFIGPLVEGEKFGAGSI